MPNIKSAKKRVLVIEKKTLQNKAIKSALKTQVKKFLAAVEAGNKEEATKLYEEKEAEFMPEQMRELERVVLLKTVDRKWMDHIDDMEQLKNGIGLRAYAQRDPVVEFKFEGYNMFEEMIAAIREDTIKYIFHVRIEAPPERKAVAEPTSAGLAGDAQKKPAQSADKVGRNDLCPCGSGKKYKKCCGAE